VRKWLTTYRVAGTRGLHDRSRTPRLSSRPWPFTKLQLGVKDLEDIPIYWPQMRRLALPPHQLTCRGLRTGATFFAFASENTMTNSRLFQAYVAEHLKMQQVGGRWSLHQGNLVGELVPHHGPDLVLDLDVARDLRRGECRFELRDIRLL